MRLTPLVLAIVITAGVAAGAPAVESPSAALDRDPDYVAVRALIKDKNFAQALDRLGRLGRDYPREAEVASLTGFALRNLGRLDEALVAYGEALRRDAYHLGANEYVGELYVTLGRLDLAKERFAVLMQVCGPTCEETQDLARAIERAEKP